MTLNLFFGAGGTFIDPIVPIVVLAMIMLWMKVSTQKSRKNESIIEAA
jgi:gluconate:H+ symporter, GntP family